MDTIATEDRLGLSFSERLPLAFTHGQGSRVWDEAGRSYLDFTSGWGVTCLGHAHPRVLAALSRQAARLMQAPNAGFTYSPERAALLALLQRVLPANLQRLFFCSSGAEANDAALKLARKVTGRSEVICARGAFHGRTWNTLSVSRDGEYVERFLPRVPGISFVPYGDLDAAAARIGGNTAAVIVEPVQGEGGVRLPPAGYLAGLQRLCRQHGALLVIDEVQTGFCRTGRFFALEHSAEPVEPAMLTLGKGIAGGFPFAALAVSASVASRLARDDHGGTYCGNPLGCAVSHAVISQLLEDGVAARVAGSGEVLLASLHVLRERHTGLLREVRGLGLLCALEFEEPARARKVTLRCADKGLLVVPTRQGVIRLLPDLLVTREDLERAVEILDEALREEAAEG